MAQAKVDFSWGKLTFSGEADEKWLAEQLDKILEFAAPIVTSADSDQNDGDGESFSANGGDGGAFSSSLANHIRDLKGDSNQLQRFLVAADWLRRRGEKNLTTQLVTKALGANHQKRLANPADCLNKNVAKGYCEKTSNGFFITPDGLKHLGYSS